MNGFFRSLPVFLRMDPTLDSSFFGSGLTVTGFVVVVALCVGAAGLLAAGEGLV